MGEICQPGRTPTAGGLQKEGSAVARYTLQRIAARWLHGRSGRTGPYIIMGGHMSLEKRAPAGAVAALLAAVSCIGAHPALADAPGYDVQLWATHSDNIQREPGGTADTIGIAELGFVWHDKAPWLDSDIDLDLAHEHYFQNSYGDDTIGDFIGQERLKLGDILAWDFADNFGQARIDPLAPITPANRENINYFATGPRLALPLGGETQLNASAQYGEVDYQHTPLDNTRVTGVIGLQHNISALTDISINAKDERIDFKDDQLNPDYTRPEAFARFETKGSRTELELDAGYGRLDLPGSRNSSPVGHIELTRRLSGNSTIGIELGHDYSDGADWFRAVQALGGAGLTTLSALQAGAPFLHTYGTLAWNFQLARTTVGFNGSYFRNRYQEDAVLNNELTVVNALVDRRITPVLDLALTEYLVRQQFDDSDETATEADTGLQLTWHVGEHLSIYFSYFFDKANSNVRADSFTENRVSLIIGWGHAAAVAPGPAPLRLPPLQ